MSKSCHCRFIEVYNGLQEPFPPPSCFSGDQLFGTVYLYWKTRRVPGSNFTHIQRVLESKERIFCPIYFSFSWLTHSRIRYLISHDFSYLINTISMPRRNLSRPLFESLHHPAGYESFTNTTSLYWSQLKHGTGGRDPVLDIPGFTYSTQKTEDPWYIVSSIGPCTSVDGSSLTSSVDYSYSYFFVIQFTVFTKHRDFYFYSRTMNHTPCDRPPSCHNVTPTVSVYSKRTFTLHYTKPTQGSF